MFCLYNQLSDNLLAQLQELKQQCRSLDKNSPLFYEHILSRFRILPLSLGYIVGNKLAGFVSCYLFFPECCEISLLVHPNYRKKGIAKEMFGQILPIIKKAGMKAILCAVSNASFENRLKNNNNFCFHHSEHSMTRESLKPEVIKNLENINFFKAGFKDIAVLKKIDEACFSNATLNINVRFEEVLASSHHEVYIICENQKPIGKAHLRWEQNEVIFSDIAILPEKQRQGYGRGLISFCINSSLAKGADKILLDLETNNIKALNLYTSLGFKISNSLSYYKISIAELEKFII